MRIIQVGPDESRQGGMRAVMTLLESSELAGQYGMGIIATSSKTHRIRTFLHGFRQLKNAVKAGNCDCVHIHMSENASVYRTAILIRWLKTHSCSRVIVQSHGSSVQRFFARCSLPIRQFLLNSLGAADLIVVLTPGWECWWKQILPNMRYAVVPNAVSLPEANSLSKQNNYKSTNKLDVLFMGYLGERKGTYLLISAIPEVLSKCPGTKFVFAGDGEVEQCAAYARELGVSANCDFVGWADPEVKDSLLRKASMLVLPSKEESFGIALLEAMSYGLPVVCSNGGFMHEVVDDGIDGIVFPTGDKKALAAAIGALLEDSENSQAMGRRGRSKVEQFYSVPAIVKIWQDVYAEVCS